MLFWEGLGEWLDVRGSIVIDLKIPYTYSKESWPREVPPAGDRSRVHTSEEGRQGSKHCVVSDGLRFLPV